MAFQSINRGVSAVMANLQSLIDRTIPPKTRKQLYNDTQSFASDSPLYFTFLALQTLLASVPLLLFVAFASSTILISFSSAILFSTFWIGVALCVLIPTLFATFCIATTAFAWLAGTYIVAKWLYSFVPVGKGSIAVQANGHGEKLIAEKKGDSFRDLEIDTVSIGQNGTKRNGHN